MFYRLRRALNSWQFNRIIRDIHKTPPLRIVDSDLRILSMVAVTRDIPMYLMAAKLLYRRIGHGRFVVIPDRPLPEIWKDRLLHHLGGGVTFIDIASIPVGRCQHGGCWERLLACLDLSASHYVIQMDSDTLAFGPLPEVVGAVAANRSFTLANGIPLQTVAEAVAWIEANRLGGEHINDAAQRALAQLGEAATQKYIRGSAGFTGFAKGAVSRQQAEAFHAEMESILGAARWREWGSEQIASNFLIANAPDPLVLPHPDYSTVPPGAEMAPVRFGHFIASSRYIGQRMARAGESLMPGLHTTAT
ncbi:MAG: hypothetical protein HC802_20080 [Caldilineaceae bacterium]|nr:hypothetical protein [Caldilineaceae bacterium]